MNTAIIPVIDLPFLAREINDAHRQVVFHGRSMLMEAKRAGEALIQAKAKCARGAFDGWVTKNTHVKRAMAYRYIQVADRFRADPSITVDDLAGKSIRQFLGMGPDEEPAPAPREFTREDAERTLKLHALAERGATEGEQAAASNKLASFAKEFGLTPEAVVAKAREFLPDADKTSHQRQAEEAEAKYAEARAAWEADKASRENRARDAEKRIAELEEKLEMMAARREELFTDLRSKSKEELLSLLVAAQLQLEGFGA